MATLVVTDGGTSPEYASLNAALAAANAGDTISIEGTWTSADTTAATISDDNITITTDSSSRHPGYYASSPTHYRLEVGGSHAITVNNTGATIDGLAIKQTSTGGSNEGIRMGASGGTLTVKNSILWGSNPTDTGREDGIYVANIDATINVENTIIYGFSRVGINIQNYLGGTEVTLNVNASTIWNCGHSPRSDSEGPGGIGIDSAGGTKNINVFNSIVVGNTIDSLAADFNVAQGIFGSVYWTIHNTVDSDGSITARDSGAVGAIQNKTATDSGSPPTNSVVFEDITTAPYDLRLTSHANNDAEDAHSTGSGAGLSMPSTDIVGTSRTAPYCVGAFEITSGAATVTPGVISIAGSIPVATQAAGAVSMDPAVVGITGNIPASTQVSASALSPSVSGIVLSSPVSTQTPGTVSATPGVLGLSLGVQAPTVVPGTVTLSPDAKSFVISIPAVTEVPGEVVTLPDVLGAAVSIPAPQLLGAGVLSPATLTALLTVSNYQATLDVLVTPDPNGFILSIPSATESAGPVFTSPDVVGATIDILAATEILGEVTATPGILVSTLSISAATESAGEATLSPDVVSTTVGSPVHAVFGAGVLSPSAVETQISVQSPAIVVSGLLVPGVVGFTLNIPQQQLSHQNTLTPSVSDITLNIQGQQLAHQNTVTPDVGSFVLNIPSHQLDHQNTLAPNTAGITMSIPAHSVALGNVLTPTQVQLTLNIPTPTEVAGTVSVSPDAVAVTASVNQVLVFAGTLTDLISVISLNGKRISAISLKGKLV